jgi:hypothetical protein
MKRMLSEEPMNLMVVIEMDTAPLKMLDPVEACILKLWRKTSPYSIAVYVSSESAISVQATNISLERGGHEPYTIID